MEVYRIHVSAKGEDGEEIETTVEKEGVSKEKVVEEFTESVSDIVEYWDLTIGKVSQVQRD